MGDMEMEEGLMKQGDEQFDFDSGGGGGAGAGGAGAAGFGTGWEDDLEMMLLKGMKKKAQRCENCDDRICAYNQRISRAHALAHSLIRTLSGQAAHVYGRCLGLRAHSWGSLGFYLQRRSR